MQTRSPVQSSGLSSQISRRCSCLHPLRALRLLGTDHLPSTSTVAAPRSRASVLTQAARRDATARASAVAELLEAPAAQQGASLPWAAMSYSQQYDELFKAPLNTKLPIDKPSKEAQAAEPAGTKVIFSDVVATKKHVQEKFCSTDWQYATFIGAMHLLCLAAPFTFSWSMAGAFFASYFVTGCLGITLSYHRQLSHKSFQTPKWLEYALAYCGVLAVQGDPLEWVSSHRYHHLHTDTPLDPHSPYEGLWWSHLGWLLDNTATLERVSIRTNAADMESQWFYRWLQKTYAWHVVAQFAMLFALGGLPAVVWAGALRMVWVYHITWAVNSASHVWGTQAFNTGDQSRNNWWVGILAWGEGWHNNHHAFEFSARHGLEWWQVDVTWMVVSGLKALGLATNVKLPSERQKARLAFPTQQFIKG